MCETCCGYLIFVINLFEILIDLRHAGGLDMRKLILMKDEMSRLNFLVSSLRYAVSLLVSVMIMLIRVTVHLRSVSLAPTQLRRQR
jgi:hypothetical protein